MRQFFSLSKKYYFQRDHDIFFHSCNLFLLKVKNLINSEASTTNFGLACVVSKKIGNAVKRNKTKRRLRVIFSKADTSRGFAYIVIAKKEIASASFYEIQTRINKSLEKFKLKSGTNI